MTVKKRIILSLILGLIVIFIVAALTSTMLVFLPYNMLYTPFIRLVLFLNPLLGGLVVGYVIRKKGWYYGAILGILDKMLSLALISLVFIIPVYDASFSRSEVYAMTYKNILKTVFSLPLAVILTSLGGYIGEYLSCAKPKVKKKN